MSKFSDPNYKLLKDYFDILVATRSGTDKSYLIGPNKTVVSQGGLYTILYEDNPDAGYIGHRFSITEIVGNRFKMIYRGLESTFSAAVPLSGASADPIGNDFYFRKDSFFHYWLARPTQDDAYHDYCNQDKTFLYFGKLWREGESLLNKYVIEFEGLKDFTLKALPEHNQTVNITEWLKVYWDQIHHEMYNMTKNFWAMLDAREIDIRWLGYIASIYGIEITEGILNEISLREWVENLPYFLKRVGTYNALYIVWKVFVQNTSNQLNVYERWGEWCTQTLDLSAGNFTDDFVDHHFLEFYGTQPSGGAGDFYYSQYDPSGYPTHTQTSPNTCTPTSSGNYVLTPHYKVQIDLTSEPLGDIFDDAPIISENVINELYKNFEYARPVAKYAHYEELVAPLATMKTGDSRNLYPLVSNGYLNTIFTGYQSISAAEVENTYEHYQRYASSTWTINHNLNSRYVLIQPWILSGTSELNTGTILPDSIQIINNNIIVMTFASAVRGVAVVAGVADTTGITYLGTDYASAGNSTWSFNHNLYTDTPSGYSSNVGPVAMYWDRERYRILPDRNVDYSDDNQRATWSIPQSGGTLIRRSDYIHTQNDPSTQWSITHNLNTWVIPQFYDITIEEEIFPDRIVLTDSNNMEVYWSSNTRGYANIVSVPRTNVVYSPYDCDDYGLGICTDKGYWKVGTGTSSVWNPFVENDLESVSTSGTFLSVDDDTYNIYIDFVVPTTDNDIDIREVGLFNYLGDMVFYSRTSGMYKLDNTQAYFHYRIGKATSSSSSSSSVSSSSSSSSSSLSSSSSTSSSSFSSSSSSNASSIKIAEIDVLEHDTVNGQYNSIVSIDTTHFIVAFSGNGSDGFISTFSNDGSYDNIALIDGLEHEISLATYNSLVSIDSNNFMLAYGGVSDDGFIKTFSIDGAYDNITEIDALEHDTLQGLNNSLVQIDSTHYILAYAGDGNDGYLKTFSINATGGAITQIDVLEHDTTYGRENSLIMIDSTHFMLAYRNTSLGAVIKTFSIDGAYDNITEIDSLNHDSYAQYCSLVMLDSTHFMLAYMDASVNGIIKTFSIDGGYNISQINSYTHDSAGWNSYNSLVARDSTYCVLACTGEGNDGYIKIFSVDGSYNISLVAELEHDILNGTYNSIVMPDTSHAVLAYAGDGDDGYVKTFSINL